MKTIMVVDDEVSILNQIKNYLENDNFIVTTANNSRKAIELIEEKSENDFDVILIDSIIPDTNTPALFLMKQKSKKDIDTTKTENFLQKPFTKEQLIDFIKKRTTN